MKALTVQRTVQTVIAISLEYINKCNYLLLIAGSQNVYTLYVYFKLISYRKNRLKVSYMGGHCVMRLFDKLTKNYKMRLCYFCNVLNYMFNIFNTMDPNVRFFLSHIFGNDLFVSFIYEFCSIDALGLLLLTFNVIPKLLHGNGPEPKFI